MAVGQYSPPSGAGATPTTPATDAPTTPTPTPTPAGPQGPISTPQFGTATPPTNIPARGQQTFQLDPNIANQVLIGGSQLPGTAGQPAKQLTETALVQEIAAHEGVKVSKGQSLEVALVNHLAKKYGVRIESTYKGTGNKQGAVGELRHNIASWFDDAQRDVNKGINATNPGPSGKGVVGTGGPQNDTGRNPQPVESKAALHDMLVAVAKKTGASGAQPLNEIAQTEGQATETQALPGTQGGQQTAGEAWIAFVKTAVTGTGTNTKLTAQGQQWATDLENAGYLDKSANNTGPTVEQVAGAYQQLLTSAVQSHTSVQDALTNPPPSAGAGPEPTSEMEAYTQGVATEFGVYLTPDQLNQIANQFQPVATTTGYGPSSVADEIKDAVVALYDPTNPNNPPGVANTMFTNIQEQALAYQIPITPQQIGQMVKTAMQGATIESMYVAADSAMNAAKEQFQKQAEGLYPSLSGQISAGQTVQNLVAPYFNVAEAYTGVPASTMMADQQNGGVSKWAGFLQGGQDPKTGAPTTMTLDQWKKTLMQDPQYGFDKTQGARDMSEQLVSAILNEFGRVNTNGSSSQPFNQYNGASALSANTAGSGG